MYPNCKDVAAETPAAELMTSPISSIWTSPGAVSNGNQVFCAKAPAVKDRHPKTAIIPVVMCFRKAFIFANSPVQVVLFVGAACPGELARGRYEIPVMLPQNGVKCHVFAPRFFLPRYLRENKHQCYKAFPAV